MLFIVNKMSYNFTNESLDVLLDNCFRLILTDRDAILKRDHPKHNEYRAILREIRAREKQYKGLVERSSVR